MNHNYVAHSFQRESLSQSKGLSAGVCVRARSLKATRASAQPVRNLPLQREIRLVLEGGRCWHNKHGVWLGDGDFLCLAGVLSTVWAVDLPTDD